VKAFLQHRHLRRVDLTLIPSTNPKKIPHTQAQSPTHTTQTGKKEEELCSEPSEEDPSEVNQLLNHRFSELPDRR
jgi:hypothetical protein